jgi:hypothetical protein
MCTTCMIELSINEDLKLRKRKRRDKQQYKKINLLNFKEFLMLIGLLKYYNINYKAFLFYSIKLD